MRLSLRWTYFSQSPLCTALLRSVQRSTWPALPGHPGSSCQNTLGFVLLYGRRGDRGACESRRMGRHHSRV
ncbi:Hypothetical protein SMAX5B_020914 [Scophthalmus maximus]|uniref:Uncharacterized protein n=1 Tax=Scophthalmus maximus TaxID=52904 RepID=A0A2U9CWV4_SCOMX|nr:Hypothetical protein SMAX5B_020914 [Scophthalmus maximus]